MLIENKRTPIRTPSQNKVAAALEQWEEGGGITVTSNDLDYISESMGVSRNDLEDYFRNVLHTKFFSWRKVRRISMAKSILMDTTKSYTDVAWMIGMTDVSNFRREFIEVVGMSPKEWREGRRR